MFDYSALWKIYDQYGEEMPDFIDRLSRTPPMKRLKHIGMNCGCEYVALHSHDMCRRYTRFEHSVGVALIVWHFTHDVRQAVAGLFHDISTPVFAHVVDFLNEDHLKQESTELSTAAMIENSPEIQAILREYGLETSDVSDYHLYPIADNSSPQLSADRLEYTFGNFIQYGVCGVDDIARFFNALTSGTNEYGQQETVFADPALAEEFALCSMKCSYVYISDSDRFTMQFLADMLKAAIRAEILTPEDLYSTEEAVIERLEAAPYFRRYWHDYCRIKAVRRTSWPVPDSYCVRINAKRRFLDPYVKDIGRVSEFSKAYRAALDEFLSVSFEDWLSIAE